jgi:hypothetical protein
MLFTYCIAGGFMMKVFKGGNAPVRSVEKEMETAKIAAEAAANMPPIELVSRNSTSTFYFLFLFSCLNLHFS